MHVSRNAFSSTRIQKNMFMKISPSEQREVQAFSLPPCSVGNLWQSSLWQNQFFNPFDITSGKTSRYFTALLVVKQTLSRNLCKTAYSLHNVFVFIMCVCMYLYSCRKADCGNTTFISKNPWLQWSLIPLMVPGCVISLFFFILFCASKKEEQRPSFAAATFLLRTSVPCCLSDGVRE